MALSALTQPHTFMAGYSSLPLRVYSDQVQSTTNFKYLINIGLSKSVVDSAIAVGYLQDVYTQVTFEEPHDFVRGDSVMIDDSINNNYSNFYTVMSVVNSTTIIINLLLGPAMSGGEVIYKIIPFTFDPDLQDEAKIDLSNTLKNFVTQNISDVNDIFAAPDTRLDYSLIMGKKADEIYLFEDNVFVNGSVGFYNSSLPDSFTATTNFQIGDVIVIEQDLVEWNFYDNFFNAGELAFTGTTGHNFRSGQTVTISGQITQPAYNGPVQIRSVINDTSFSTWKTFTTSTPAEAGTAIGIPRPEYNGTATIIDIYYDSGIVIVTDKGFTDSSLPIGGNIRLANPNTIPTINDLSITGLSIYNAHIDTVDYGFSTTQFDPYVCQVRSASANNISTLLGNTERYRIEPSTKSWLLAHTFDVGGNYWSPRFKFYNSAGSLLSQYKLNLTYQYGPQVEINSYSNNGGNLRLNLNSAHNLTVGDALEIFQAPSAYLGVTTVTAVNSSTSITVNKAYTGSGVFGAEFIKSLDTNGAYDYYFPVGLNQINADTNKTLQSGSSLSSIINNVDYYTVELEYAASANTNAITFEVNDDCSRYEMFHLMWKDRYGSWLSYPFKYISNETTEVDRKNYYKTEGRWDLNNDTFGYDKFGRGEQTYFSRSRDRFLINSGWVEEYENVLMKDLMQSTSVYVQMPDGTLLGAQITNKDIQLRKKQSDYLWNYSFEFRVSNNEVRF